MNKEFDDLTLEEQQRLINKLAELLESEDMPTQTAQATSTQNIDINQSKKIYHVERGGDRIILPDGMSYKEGRDWLSRQEQAEEQKVGIADSIPCFPLDGLVALSRAMTERYGFTQLEGWRDFFGDTPPTMVQVPTHKGFETAPYSKMMPPKWEGGYLEPVIRMEAMLHIGGEIKKKFEYEVKEVITLARKFIKEKSIYRGQAVLMDLSFLDPNMQKKFHPVNDAPKFMDLSRVDELILNKSTQFELATSLYMLLERTNECMTNRIKLKHGVLLGGPYGTGKTLTAKAVAQKAIRNGWTFIYLSRAQDLANGLRIAQLYSPAVLFAEDVDAVASGTRDEYLNNLLNTIDGVDTKDVPIITVLTTNHEEQISPAFMRAGRIDTIIKFSAPEAETAVQFIKAYARNEQGESLLNGDDLTEAGKAMAGLVPAFIAEAIAKAKRYAIYRCGGDIVGQITVDDLVLAAQSIKTHVEMTKDPVRYSDADRVADAWRLMSCFVEDGNLEYFEPTVKLNRVNGDA